MKLHQWEQHKAALTAKFYSLVDKGGPDECWPWLGGKNSGGYGSFTWRYVRYTASDVAFAIKTGRPLSGFGCHSCDNPGCANPRHIVDGTPQQNTDEMFNRGRHTTKRVDRAEILRLQAMGLRGAQIAARIGCSQPVVSKVLRKNGLGRIKVTEEMIYEWVEKRKRGMSCAEIAAEYGVKRAKVSKYTKDAFR